MLLGAAGGQVLAALVQVLVQARARARVLVLVVVVAGQQQPVEQLKENSEELLLSSPHEHRQRCLFAFPLLFVCPLHSFA